MKHVVSVSSGLGSAFTWKLLCDEHGADNVVGVFTDVNGEHPDNYRFLAETQYELGSRLVKVTNDGKTIWDVMIEQRFLANTRVDICSRILKREAMKAWLKNHCDPDDTTVYLGIDWTEIHRFDRARPRWAKDGWTVKAPMCEPPYRHKGEAQAWLDDVGIKRPALYDMGFGHANCGGGCVKAGIGQFKKLLVADRRWYTRWWEAGEEKVRAHLDKDVSILRDRSIKSIIKRLGFTEREIEQRKVEVDDDLDPGEKRTAKVLYIVRATDEELPRTLPLPLRMLREQVEGDPTLYDDEPDEPGCGVCFIGDEDDTPNEEAA